MSSNQNKRKTTNNESTANKPNQRIPKQAWKVSPLLPGTMETTLVHGKTWHWYVFGICRMELQDCKIPPCFPLKPRTKTTAQQLHQLQFPKQQIPILYCNFAEIACLAKNDFSARFLDGSFNC